MRRSDSRWVTSLALTAGLVLAAGASAAPTVKRGILPSDVYRFPLITDLEVSPDGHWAVYELESAERRGDNFSHALYLLPLDTGQPRRLTPAQVDGSHPRFSPDGRSIAFLSDRGAGQQIWLAKTGATDSRAVTDVSEGVGEFGWSGDGLRFVFTRTDPWETGKRRGPHGDASQHTRAGSSTTPVSSRLRARFDRDHRRASTSAAQATPRAAEGESADERAGEALPYVVRRSLIRRDGEGILTADHTHLWVVGRDGGHPKRLTEGEWDDAEPQWSPDGTWIAFTSNRGPDPDASDDSDVFVVHPDGTGLRKLSTSPGPDDTPRWSHRSDRLAWVSAPQPNDFYRTTRVVVAALDGDPPVELGAGLDSWVAADSVLGSAAHCPPAWSGDDATVYVTVERRGANYLAALPAAGGPAREVLGGRFVVDLPRYSPARHGFVFTRTDATHPPEVQTVAEDGSGARPLTHLSDALLAGLELSQPEVLTARNPDGDAIEAWLYPPLHPQPDHRYPLVVYLHGGPQAYDGDYFDTGLENQLLPAAGIAVLRVNYRGSTSYGEAFCRSVWGDWHRREHDDVMAALDEALRRPWLDPERLGIGGWSYGGILTVWAVGHTQRFRVAVPERFEVDYLSAFGEDQWFAQYLAELGSPLEHEALYRRLSPGSYAAAIKTPLHLISDEDDGNCPLSQAMQFYQRMRLLGVPVELVVYPGESHTMSRPSHLQDRLERLLDWFGTLRQG